MKQTALSQNGSSLLNYAISKLNPEVFSHPIWLRFGKKEVSPSLKVTDDLFSTAKNLQVGDPSAACQVLLLCAVYQNYAGQQYNALGTAQKALALAQSCGLSKETIWAMWGACAISVQRGNYEQATSHLLDLQVILTEQNEWILAGFVDVVKQSLFQPVKVGTGNNSGSPRDRPFEDLLTLTFDWLQQWGFSDGEIESEFVESIDRSERKRSLFSNKQWKSRWHSLTLAFWGELKLQWAGNDPSPSKRQFSIMGFKPNILFRAMIGRYFHDRVEEAADKNHYIPQHSVLDRMEEFSPTNVPSPPGEPMLSLEKIPSNQLSNQATTLITLAVYTLGAFSMIIRDQSVKLRVTRGLSVLKFLLFHHSKKIPREVLMDLFWPDARPETARNNLNVAIHGLRRSLRATTNESVIMYDAGAYGLNPNLLVWLDVENFESCIRKGQRFEERDQITAALAEYEAAIHLYQGDFLEQNPYEEWTILERERLRIAFLDTLDRVSQIYFEQEHYAMCITVCHHILNRDRCREDTHCLLMRSYSRQGQYHLALRQYQICAEILELELQIEPSVETRQLYDFIRHHKQV